MPWPAPRLLATLVFAGLHRRGAVPTLARRGSRTRATITVRAASRAQRNVRRRGLAKAGEQANGQLANDGAELLPEGLTPHSLRRTFASLLFALGEAPPYVPRDFRPHLHS